LFSNLVVLDPVQDLLKVSMLIFLMACPVSKSKK